MTQVPRCRACEETFVAYAGDICLSCKRERVGHCSGCSEYVGRDPYTGEFQTICPPCVARNWSRL